MTEVSKSDKVDPRTTISPSDMDDQGRVTIWDRGPQPLGADPTHDERRMYDADIRAWKVLHGDGSFPIKMHANDAVHAVTADPGRYSLDPIDDEAAIEAEVQKIQDARAADEKAAEERAKAVQLAADRQQAVTNLMARRAAPPRKTAPTELEAAALAAESAAEADGDEVNRLRASGADPEVVEVARVKAAASRSAAIDARYKADTKTHGKLVA